MSELLALVHQNKIDFKLKKEWRDSPTTIAHTDFSKIDLSKISFEENLVTINDKRLKKTEYKDPLPLEKDPMLDLNRKVHNFCYTLDVSGTETLNFGKNASVIGTLKLNLSKNSDLKIELGEYSLVDIVIIVNCVEDSNCKLSVFSRNSGITYIRFKKALSKNSKLELINSHIKDNFLFLQGDCDLDENSDLQSKIYSYSYDTAHCDCVQNVNLGFQSKAHVIGRGVIEGAASLIFRGALRLYKDKANGNFETKTINLSKEGAFTDSVPILDISAQDVLAKHSSSIESIDKEDIFYLMSRGFSEKEASELIIDSFLLVQC